MRDLSNRNIIILSSIDWDSHRQLHHELIDYLLKKKNKILFVENTGSRTVRITDLTRIKKRFSNFVKSSKGFKKINKNITSFSPIFFPFYFNFIFQLINDFMIISPINKWINKNEFDRPILINFIPNPITYSILKNIKSDLKIYYMADNMTQNDLKFKKIEEKIINLCKLVFFSSRNLKKKIKINSKRVFLPNGVNDKIFKNLKLNKKYKKNQTLKIVYLGAVRDIINENLILKITREFPDDKVFFIGPVLKKFEKLNKQKNIFFLGEIKHKKVPNVLRNFHLGILPYKVNGFTKSINPLKIYEYISSGLPVVSTNLPNVSSLIEKYPNLKLFTATNEKKFLQNISYIKKNYKQNKKTDIKLFLKQNAWTNRFRILERLTLVKEYESKYIDKKVFQISKFKMLNFLINSLFLITILVLINFFFKII